MSRPSRGKTIKQFMWAYQHHFRRSVHISFERVLEEIGHAGDPGVLLIGFQAAGPSQYKICIEPEEGAYGNVDLSHVSEDAENRFANHPNRKSYYTDQRIQGLRTLDLADQCRAEALADALRKSEPGRGRAFFCGRSVRVDDYEVHVVLSVDADALNEVPQIKTTIFDNMAVAQSLVHAAIRDVLGRASRTLSMPDPGEGLSGLGAGTSEVVRSATSVFLYSALLCTGQLYAQQRDFSLNSISALPYEKRWGAGRIILAKQQHPSVDVLVTLQRPVGLHNTQAVRKLMEASGKEADLVSDGEYVYGFGLIGPNYDADSESVFVVTIAERGVWEVSHNGRALLTVRDSAGHLPRRRLNSTIFNDIVSRRIPDANLERLELLAEAAEKHEHGAMLIISSAAVDEAKRLAPQAWDIEPVALSLELLTQLTGMDGGVLVDAEGRCHAVGVILDGMAQGTGDPSRGSRFNNAVRYLASSPPAAVVVVYSTDGTINILPELMPRADRRVVDSVVRAYLSAAEVQNSEFAKLAELWRDVKAVRFYLSEDQCTHLNAARSKVDALNNASIIIVEHDLKPCSDMDDSYWI